MIDSKADADKNKLSTDTISYSDIKNEAEWSAETKGVNYQKGDGVANKDKGLTPNFSGSKGKDDSTTKSAIAPGEIEIRSDEGKEEKDKTDLADLSRDPDKADKIFDKDKILEKQQAAALFGEIGFTLAGEIIRSNGWDNDDPRAVALHGIIGGLMAEINGGNFGEGLTVAAINKLVFAKLQENQKKLGLSGSDIRWISVIFWGTISEGIGGNFGQGASITDSATKYNGLTLTIDAPTATATVSEIIVNGIAIFVFLDGMGNELSRLALPDAYDSGHIECDFDGNIVGVYDELGIYRPMPIGGQFIGDNFLLQKKAKEQKLMPLPEERG